MKRGILQRAAAAPHVVWSALFIIAPLIFVLYYTFTGQDGSFSLDNITRLGKGNYLMIFVNSLCMALIATVICFVIAYPAAYIFSRMKKKSQKLCILLIMLPLWMNFLITTYSWMTILEDTGVINTLLGLVGLGPVHMINTPGAVITGMVFCFLPYMILPIYSVMAGIDPKLLEAAADLGCSPVQIFMKVVWPLSVGGVISGVTMVFVPSVSTFYISQKLGGGTFQLIGDTIESYFTGTAVNYHFGAALSLILMVLILISMAVMNRFGDDEQGGALI
ncbi:MAG: ABC transporter permease [Firmicutes bacterium]|nr:ABC transporter permease [Bacillota bacterium]MBQ6261262.1 ABC transporter permease [Bacillota bacterium]MBR0440659.1 ABC transporter permease [Bacillota bacterium]MBR0522828.1 ABC transporter permease [Bacillota bacterium]